MLPPDLLDFVACNLLPGLSPVQRYYLARLCRRPSLTSRLDRIWTCEPVTARFGTNANSALLQLGNENTSEAVCLKTFYWVFYELNTSSEQLALKKLVSRWHHLARWSRWWRCVGVPAMSMLSDFILVAVTDADITGSNWSSTISFL